MPVEQPILFAQFVASDKVGDSAASGTRARIRVPTFGLESTSIVPFKSCTRSLTLTNPRPLFFMAATLNPCALPKFNPCGR